MNTSPPSRLVFLHDLMHCELNEKVRFLCCIDRHRTRPGAFYAVHDYPKDTKPRALIVVDFEHLTESVKSVDLQVGSWINVVGYVSKIRSSQIESEPGLEDLQKSDTLKVLIQAIMLWSAGAIKLDEYEKALEDRKASELL